MNTPWRYIKKFDINNPKECNNFTFSLIFAVVSLVIFEYLPQHRIQTELGKMQKFLADYKKNIAATNTPSKPSSSGVPIAKGDDLDSYFIERLSTVWEKTAVDVFHVKPVISSANSRSKFYEMQFVANYQDYYYILASLERYKWLLVKRMDLSPHHFDDNIPFHLVTIVVEASNASNLFKEEAPIVEQPNETVQQYANPFLSPLETIKNDSISYGRIYEYFGAINLDSKNPKAGIQFKNGKQAYFSKGEIFGEGLIVSRIEQDRVEFIKKGEGGKPDIYAYIKLKKL